MLKRWIHLNSVITVLFFLGSESYADLSDDIEDEPLPIKKEITPQKKQTPVKKPPKTKSLKPSQLDKTKEKIKPKPKNKLVEKKQPVRFTSVGARGNREKGIIELKQKVRVFQNDFSLSANKATIYLDKKTDEVERVEAVGNVRVEKVDAKTGEKIKAKANSAVFFEKQQKVVMKGNASFLRGKDLIKGKIITYEMNTGWISAEKVDGIVSP